MAQLPGRYGNKEKKMTKREIEYVYEPEVVEITTSCSPVATGSIYAGGWGWSYPAIGKVAGTAGNLERWSIGHKEKNSTTTSFCGE